MPDDDAPDDKEKKFSCDDKEQSQLVSLFVVQLHATVLQTGNDMRTDEQYLALEQKSEEIARVMFAEGVFPGPHKDVESCKKDRLLAKLKSMSGKQIKTRHAQVKTGISKMYKVWELAIKYFRDGALQIPSGKTEGMIIHDMLNDQHKADHHGRDAPPGWIGPHWCVPLSRKL